MESSPPAENRQPPNAASLRRSIFQDLLELLVGSSAIRVNFEDLTGFTFDAPDFSLDIPFRQHCSPLCALAKKAPGRLCFQSKRVCNRLALTRGGVEGMCRFGLWEIVEPLRVGGKTLGVFYVGGVVLAGQEARGEAQIRTLCRLKKLDPALYLASYAAMPRVDAAAWSEHRRFFYHTLRLLTRLVEALAPPCGEHAVQPYTNVVRLQRQHSNLTRKALDHVTRCFAQDCTLNAVAESLGCHPVHLSRTFKAEVGVAFHQYVLRVRILHAKRLLNTRNMNVTRVAYEVGFADSSHFCRVFKEHTGQTPAVFIRNAQRV